MHQIEVPPQHNLPVRFSMPPRRATTRPTRVRTVTMAMSVRVHDIDQGYPTIASPTPRHRVYPRNSFDPLDFANLDRLAWPGRPAFPSKSAMDGMTAICAVSPEHRILVI